MELPNEKSRFQITPLEERVVPCGLPNLCSLQTVADLNAQVGTNGVTVNANVLGNPISVGVGLGTGGCS